MLAPKRRAKVDPFEQETKSRPRSKSSTIRVEASASSSTTLRRGGPNK
jgi:hypothetical protein